MADQATVGEKFEQWARSLPEDEQEAVAEWMSRAGGDEVRGFGANWWQEENAWSGAWTASWNSWSS